MTTDTFITEEQIKGYYDNPPAIAPTKEHIESARKLVDKYFTFTGETNDC